MPNKNLELIRQLATAVIPALLLLCLACPATATAADDRFILDLPPLTDSEDTGRNQNNLGEEEERASLLLEYFNRCMEIIYVNLSIDTRIGYCACTGDKLDAGFSTPEIFTMAKGEGKPVDPMKLALDVYIPCLHYPVWEAEKNKCYIYERTSFYLSTEAYESACDCWGQSAAAYLEKYGRDLAAVLFMNMEIPPADPLIAIRNSKAYKMEWNKWRDECRSQYAYQ